FLLSAFRSVNQSVALSFGIKNRGALVTFGPHLPFHRGADIIRRPDVFDLVTQDLYAPRFSRLVYLTDDMCVDRRPLRESPIELNIPDPAPHGCLRTLNDSYFGIRDPIRCIH